MRILSSLVLQTALIALLLSGCQVPPLPSRVIYEDPVNFVRLDPDVSVLPDVPRTRHSHPLRIDVEDMVKLLKGLTAQEHRNSVQRYWGGDATKEAVFTDQEIALLAPRLVEALAEAAPDERVTFYLSRPQTSIKREITSGGLYVRGKELHFILGNYRIIYGIPAYGMVYDRRYPLKPTAPKGFDLSFEPTGTTIVTKAKLWDRLWGREKDEMVIDLEKLRRA
jgi:hypothetical protein